MNDRNALARDTLVVIAGIGPANGAAVRQELNDYYADSVNSGYFYTMLDRLVEARLVSKTPRTGRAFDFEVTQAGYRCIVNRHRWEDRLVDDVAVDAPAAVEVTEA